jgi:hypothetical protein
MAQLADNPSQPLLILVFLLGAGLWRWRVGWGRCGRRGGWGGLDVSGGFVACLKARRNGPITSNPRFLAASRLTGGVPGATGGSGFCPGGVPDDTGGSGFRVVGIPSDTGCSGFRAEGVPDDTGGGGFCPGGVPGGSGGCGVRVGGAPRRHLGRQFSGIYEGCLACIVTRGTPFGLFLLIDALIHR